jgi:hypothetical protein
MKQNHYREKKNVKNFIYQSIHVCKNISVEAPYASLPFNFNYCRYYFGKDIVVLMERHNLPIARSFCTFLKEHRI